MTAPGDSLDLVTFGEAMALLLAEPGVPLTEAASFRRTAAGSESNVAIALARLGHRAGWFGRLGADAFGDTVLRAIRGEGVDTSHVRIDPDAPTGLLVRDCHEQRPVEVLYFRSNSAGSRLHPDDIDPAYIGAARFLHVSGITPVLSDDARAATAAAISAARDAGRTVTFDPNVRLRLAGPERIRETLTPLAKQADIVLAGADEARLLSGIDDDERAAAWFLDLGARLVVIKAGSDGAWATDGTQRWVQSARPVRVLDPVGAGDAFAAGFLSGLIENAAPEECLARGAALGAMAVQAAGDVEGLPRAGEAAAIATWGDGDVRR
ncbi:MAG TPA: sugar kinase [Mycobacteriales bacterium]|nr:sugar kinase [Mycobacteriales bacterium]